MSGRSPALLLTLLCGLVPDASVADAASIRAADAHVLQAGVDRLHARYPQVADLQDVRDRLLVTATMLRVLSETVVARNQTWIEQLARLGDLPAGWRIQRVALGPIGNHVALHTPDGDCGAAAQAGFAATLGVPVGKIVAENRAATKPCHWRWNHVAETTGEAGPSVPPPALAAPRPDRTDALDQAEFSLIDIHSYLVNAEAYGQMRVDMVQLLERARPRLLPPAQWTAADLADAVKLTGTTSARMRTEPEPDGTTVVQIIQARGGLAALVNMLEHLTTTAVDGVDGSTREPLLQRQLLAIDMDHAEGMTIRYRDRATSLDPPEPVAAAIPVVTQGTALADVLALDHLSTETRERVTALWSRPGPPITPPPLLEWPVARSARTVRRNPFE